MEDEKSARMEAWLMGFALHQRDYASNTAVRFGRPGTGAALRKAAEDCINFWAGKHWDRRNWPLPVADWARASETERDHVTRLVTTTLLGKQAEARKHNTKRLGISPRVLNAAIAASNQALPVLLELHQAIALQPETRKNWRVALSSKGAKLLAVYEATKAEAAYQEAVTDAVVELLMYNFADSVSATSLFVDVHDALTQMRSPAKILDRHLAKMDSVNTGLTNAANHTLGASAAIAAFGGERVAQYARAARDMEGNPST